MAEVFRVAAPLKTESEPTPATSPETTQTPDAPATTAEAEGADSKPQRPDNVPEKFWDAETGAVNTDALLESYKALETKVGKPPAPETPVKPELKVPDPAKGILSDAEMTAYGEEVSKNGSLSEASYKALETKGFPKVLVDQFIAGQVAIVKQGDSELMTEAGGADAWKSIDEWASQNLEVAELEAFNATMAKGDRAGKIAAIRGLKARYEAGKSNPPAKRVAGANPTAAKRGDIYHSMAEFAEDAGKPEYESSPAFRRKCAEKLARSQKAGKV